MGGDEEGVFQATIAWNTPLLSLEVIGHTCRIEGREKALFERVPYEVVYGGETICGFG